MRLTVVGILSANVSPSLGHDLRGSDRAPGGYWRHDVVLSSQWSCGMRLVVGLVVLAVPLLVFLVAMGVTSVEYGLIPGLLIGCRVFPFPGTRYNRVGHCPHWQLFT
jgi:hypothetical protein